ncbi:MAG: DNA polymerase IV [Pseudomonadota bacterium]
MSEARRILHVDMDAFYASVEQRDNPELRGKPLVVGGGSNRGVVAAASYESREFGIRSAMPMREARRRCPDLLQVAPRMSHYKAVSTEVFDIFRTFTPVVEGLSLDEAFLDVTASVGLFGEAETMARSIKDAIQDRTALTASVGVAPNKLVAKIASDLDKPDGLVVVAPDQVQSTLDPLPAAVIPGIGRVTLQKLQNAGIETIRDLRTAADGTLRQLFGRYAHRMRDRASGIDDRPVASARVDKSISAEQTFGDDIRDVAALDAKLLALTERVATRIRAKELAAGKITIKIRQADFTTFTRQCTLTPPSNGTDQIFAAARRLLRDWLRDHPETPLRLLGVGGGKFAPALQQDLFGSREPAPASPLDQAVDDVRERFGDTALGRARNLEGDQIG